MNYTDLPQPAILIAHSRSGSTFLSHCLDSHPQICCERGGPFNPAHTWLKTGISNHNLAWALWERQGCRVSMFRITQRQFKNGYVTLETMREFEPKVIYLSRKNILRAFISSQLATAAVQGELNHPLHSYKAVEQQELTLDCDGLLEKIRDYEKRTKHTLKTLSEFPLLHLTYEDITPMDDSGELPDEAANNITGFLDVCNCPMKSDLKKVNTKPVVKNWDDIVGVLGDTEYEWMVG